MICIAALIVFAILGIFSLNYRRLAKEAWLCVLRRVRFQPCETQLSEKVRMEIVARILKKSHKGATFINRSFEVLAFIFVILFIGSTILAGRGLYNLVRFKTCDLKNPEECPLAPKEACESEEAQKEEVKGIFNPDPFKKGADEAKIKIEEFSDFECPACGLAFKVYQPVFLEYSDKIQIAFRHFPLPMHRNAMKAAQAAEAAGSQDKFWEYHDLLFGKQAEWSKALNPTRFFIDYAKSLELDEKRFEEDLESKEIKQKIEKDFEEGEKIGISATPTFVINGQPQVGVIGEEKLKQIIEEELSRRSD